MNKEPYFTSDWHLDNRISSRNCEQRGFKFCADMNNVIIDNVIKTVPKGSILFNLGDLSSTLTEDFLNPYLNRLWKAGIQMQWIYGNHDYKKTFNHRCISWQGWQKTIKCDGQKIFLNHYPCHVWDSSHYGAWHLFGHIHTGDATDKKMKENNITFLGKMYNVNIDMNDMKPLSFSEIKVIMDSKNDNWDKL